MGAFSVVPHLGISLYSRGYDPTKNPSHLSGFPTIETLPPSDEGGVIFARKKYGGRERLCIRFKRFFCGNICRGGVAPPAVSAVLKNFEYFYMLSLFIG